jgi:nucleoside-diphosphate-sugar epimerase
MRVFVAGATGAIGRQLVPLLVEAGHEVTGVSRSVSGVERLRAQGASGVRVDVFDAGAVEAAVRAAAPDAIVHQLTALAGGSVSDNRRVRVDGTRNLVAAARAAGVDRIVAQSIAFAYEPGDGPADERTPLDVRAPSPRAETIGGVLALERAVAELGRCVILRYGLLYGPGTWHAPGAAVAQRLRAGTVAANEAVGSFVHVADAARAAVLALDWPSGAVNVVDDEPAPAREWLPALAAALGEPAPEPSSGRAGWERGADNTYARTSLGWEPRFPTWRTGFAGGLV